MKKIIVVIYRPLKAFSTLLLSGVLKLYQGKLLLFLKNAVFFQLLEDKSALLWAVRCTN